MTNFSNPPQTLNLTLIVLMGAALLCVDRQTDRRRDRHEVCNSHFHHLFPKVLNRRLFTFVYAWLTEIYQVCSLCGVHLRTITLLQTVVTTGI
jgi:hypothetical protein